MAATSPQRPFLDAVVLEHAARSIPMSTVSSYTTGMPNITVARSGVTRVTPATCSRNAGICDASRIRTSDRRNHTPVSIRNRR
jgi:hypothetical protein